MKNFFMLCSLVFAATFSYAQNNVEPQGAESNRPSVTNNDVAKMLDNSNTTIYQAQGTVNATTPDIVDFYFYGAKSINSITYRPSSSANGRWLNVKVYHATVDNPTNFVLGHTLTWANNNSVKTITYTTAIVKPAIIRFEVTGGVNNASTCAEMNFFSAETGTLPASVDCDLSSTSLASFTDTSVLPISSSTNTEQGTGRMAQTYDNDFATTYHSNFSFVVSASTPAELVYNFAAGTSLDYLVYHPRTDASNNGNFGLVEVQYQLAGSTTYFSWFTRDLEFNKSAAVISFPTRLNNVTSIKLRVKSGTNNNAACAEMKFYQKLSPDTKIITSGASANSTQTTSVITNSTDDNLSTIYHSNWSIPVSAASPAELTYSFSGNPSIDYLVYYPRRDAGNNGNFGEVEVQYMLSGETVFTTLLTYNAAFVKSMSVINFPTTLNNVAAIRLLVKSGTNNNASAAEMMFYKKSNFDDTVTGNVFTDDLFTALKPGTTQAQIDAISNNFFKALANCMKSGTYSYKYRVKNYQPYTPVGVLAASLKTNNYNQFEYPTGMYFETGKEVVVFVGSEAANRNISLKVTNMLVHAASQAYPTTLYTLKPGLNVLNITSSGLGYINYYTTDTSAPPVAIHITGGVINGLFDVTTDNQLDWIDAVNRNATYAQIDLTGKNMSMLLDRVLLKKYNPVNVAPLINTFDTIAKIQFNMMGFEKYNIKPKNHMFSLGHNEGGLYAGALGMHFDYSWGEANYVSVNGILNGDLWGVAHEIGHINQLRPSLLWAGMTEVSNNIFSTYTEYTMGATKYVNGRLERESSTVSLGGTSTALVGGRYKAFFDNTVVNGLNHIENNEFGRVIPFWQLQLYYQFAGALRNAPTLEQRMSGAAPAPAAGVADYGFFLADVMQAQRNRNEAGLSTETLMLNFMKDVCDATKEDLTDFFIKTGFLKPIDITINDYGTKPYQITQAAIDAAILSVKAKGYPMPVSPVIHYMSANSLNAFKNKLPVTGTYKVGATLSGTTLTVNHNSWKNVVAFENYAADNTTLLEVTVVGMRDANNTTTQIYYPANADGVYAIAYDGSKHLVYSRSTVLPVALTSFDAKLAANGVALKWITASEKDNKRFEILKSTDGVNFAKLVEVAGAGTKESETSYQYLDKDFRQSAYYKLSQTDLDGNTSIFEEQVKYVKGLGATINVYPNPAASKIYINLEGAAVTSVKLTDMMGRQLRNLAVAGSQSMEVDLSDLPRGVYTLQLVSQGKTDTRKIVKQ